MKYIALIILAAACLIAALPGCAHHAGYTDVSVEYLPVANPEIRHRIAGPYIEVASAPTVDNPLADIRLYRERIIEREAIIEHSGLAMRVPYPWSVPLVKPVLPVSIVFAAWMPARAPHDHGASGWHAGDYMRDFVAWINPFEGFPTGARELHGDRVAFRTTQGFEVMRSAIEPVGPGLINVYLGRDQIAYITINARGEGSLNLRQVFGAHPPEEMVVLRLEGAGAEGRLVVEREILAALAER